MKYFCFFLVIIILLNIVPVIAQNKQSIGISLGTSLIQNINLDLKNFEQQTINTSNDLIPTNIKANFNYYFTPNFAIRFSSGYAIAHQTNESEFDYSYIDSVDTKRFSESKFSMSGFPLETSFIFYSNFNERLSFHIGIAGGYYIFNLKAEGLIEEVESKTDKEIWKEEYDNPEMTLSGWAQFFVLGLNVNLGSKMIASFEITKMGLNYLQLEKDAIKQVIYNREVENEIRYGYEKQNYSPQGGFKDIAVSVGLYWKL